MGYNMEKRNLIPSDYVWLNGKVMPKELRETYNRLQERINKFIDCELPVPEHLLFGSHNLVSSFMESNHEH